MKKNSIITILLFFLIITNCQDNAPTEQKIIATVGDQKISLEEFRLFYELDPNFGIESSGLPALEEALNFYLYQILALQKAYNSNLTADSFFVRASDWEQRQAMLRELFRQDVQNKVEVTREELNIAYENENMTVHVRHIFSDSEEKIRMYQERIKNGEHFTTIAREAFLDSALAESGGDLGWIRLGDLDDDFASSIKNLKGSEISDVVRTHWGYHIIQVLDYRKQLLVNDSDFQRQKSMLTKKIQRQKSLTLSNTYVKSIMSKQNPQPNQDVFRLVWNTIVPLQEHEQSVLTRKHSITNVAIEKCKFQLASNLDESFIKFNGGNISLREFLERMKSIPLSHRPVFKSARELSNQIAFWVRDEFLFKKALQRGLNKNPTVMSEVRRFKEEQSYNFFLKEEIARLDVPDSVRYYFKTKSGNQQGLASFHTLQQWEWAKARENLNTELSGFPENIFIHQNFLQQENMRINWDRRIRMFMVRKPE